MYSVHLLIVSCFAISSCNVYSMDELNSQGTHTHLLIALLTFIVYASLPLLISTLDHVVLYSGDFEGIEHVCDFVINLYSKCLPVVSLLLLFTDVLFR